MRSPRITRLGAVASLVVLLGAGGCSSGSGDDTAKPKASESVEALFAAGVSELDKGNLDAAQALFERVVAKEPKNAIAHYDLGVIAQQRGNTAKALAEYEQATAADPTYVPALYNTAVIYGATDAPRAIELYRRIIRMQPNAPTAYLNLGLLEVANGQQAQGVKDLTTALKQDPTLAQGLPAPILSKVGAGAKPASPSPSPTSSG